MTTENEKNVLSVIDNAYEFLWPMPFQVLQILTGLEFKIGKFPSDRMSEEEPPLFDSYQSGEIIPIDGVLGIYYPRSREIIIFQKGINWASKLLNEKPEHLEIVVKYHEWSHAIIHIGRDENNEICSLRAYNSIENRLHETLAQLLTYHGLKHRINNAQREIARQALQKVFEVFKVLSPRQPPEYRDWNKFENVPLERLRKFMLALRKHDIRGKPDVFESLIL